MKTSHLNADHAHPSPVLNSILVPSSQISKKTVNSLKKSTVFIASHSFKSSCGGRTTASRRLPLKRKRKKWSGNCLILWHRKPQIQFQISDMYLSYYICETKKWNASRDLYITRSRTSRAFGAYFCVDQVPSYSIGNGNCRVQEC